MHPSVHAAYTPSKPALIMAASGETLTYAQLEASSNQVAHLLRNLGLKRGDCIGIMMTNERQFLELAWGAQRAGLYYVCLSSKLGLGEVAYIVRDAEVKAMFLSDGASVAAETLAGEFPELPMFTSANRSAAAKALAPLLAACPRARIADESPGIDMLYSSGTTGRPKGIRQDLPEGPLQAPSGLTDLAEELYAMGPDTIFLSPAPLYHSAPLRWSMAVQKLGGTVIVMEHFDAETALALIERHCVSHAQFVPTHFIRMLKLDPAVRARYDHSSLRVAFHAAAPCPIPVKHAMIDWWGKIIHEYYSGTEGNGFTAINSSEWLAHPGSVGRPINCRIFICDEAGEPLPAGSDGAIYFADGPSFAYHKDPEKTFGSYNRHGWSTIGDIGRVDDEGYLYLTDRKSFMIISGGVNIYPQEIEDLMIVHPKVADVAVFGAPDEDMGERVVAVVQPAQWAARGPALAEELLAFVRANLSHVKAPRQIDFRENLPRHATGKLHKRLLRDEYRDAARLTAPASS